MPTSRQATGGRPPTPLSRSKKKKRCLGGFRVFRIETSREEELQLQKLHRELVASLVWGKQTELPKGLLYYDEEYLNEVVAARGKREKAGKRTPLKRYPPIPLTVRFEWHDREGRRREYGNRGACCIINLDEPERKPERGALRIPSAGILIPLRRQLRKALKKELHLKPPPKWTLFLTHRGKLRLVARRGPAWWTPIEECDDTVPPPFRIFSLDMNSDYGLAVMAFDVDETGVKRHVLKRRFQPPNLEYLWELTSFFQWVRDKKYTATLENLKEIIERYSQEKPERALSIALIEAKLRELVEEMGPITTERERVLVRKLRRAMKISNELWVRKVLKKLRKLIRNAKGRAIIVIDPPDSESLRNRRLQKTLNSVVKAVENLAKYEGALFFKGRFSGKYCPLCMKHAEEVDHRCFACKACQLIWDRDYGACIRGAALFAPVRVWLLQHPEALAPSRSNGQSVAAAKPPRARQRQRSPGREVPRGWHTPFLGRPQPGSGWARPGARALEEPREPSRPPGSTRGAEEGELGHRAGGHDTRP